MSTFQHLYFVAVMPPEDIYAEIHAFKERIAEKYQSKAALKPPVHITLFPPLDLSEELERKFIALLDEVAFRHHTFEVQLNGFGAFPPRVIFVKPEKQMRLNAIAHDIVDSFIHHISPAMELRTFRFNAHMTIAYRDLDPSMFPAAWGEFKKKEYNRSFQVKELCLMRHDAKQWHVIHRSKLIPAKSEEDEASLDLFA